MVCRQCGGEIPSGAAECPHCSTSLVSGDTVSVTLPGKRMVGILLCVLAVILFLTAFWQVHNGDYDFCVEFLETCIEHQEDLTPGLPNYKRLYADYEDWIEEYSGKIQGYQLRSKLFGAGGACVLVFGMTLIFIDIQSRRDSGPVCPSCGAAMNREHRFCPKCGAPCPGNRFCSGCGKPIDEKMAFCPYCGAEHHSVQSAVSSVEEPKYTVNKQIPRSHIRLAAVLLAVLIPVGAVVTCEVKIIKAKELYAQGEYYHAWREVRDIPVLGREALIRIRTANVAGDYYESYQSIKENRFGPYDDPSEDAYQSAFFELTFGLYLNLRDVESDELSDIQLDEYETFIELHLEELEDMFGMSQEQAEELAEEFGDADDVDAMKQLANTWLEQNFFR